jgi:hypothetical protein
MTDIRSRYNLILHIAIKSADISKVIDLCFVEIIKKIVRHYQKA